MEPEVPEDYQALQNAEANLRNIHDLLSHSEFQGYESTKVHLALAFLKSNHDDVVEQMRNHEFFLNNQPVEDQE